MDVFDEKIALVTGASRGIGRAAALRFARDGATVVCSDVADEGGYETVEMIAGMGGTASYVHADVSSESDVEGLIAAALRFYGKLDIAFNNAGIGLFGKAIDDHKWNQHPRLSSCQQP